MPKLDPVFSNNSLGALLQAFHAAAWSSYCECTPGATQPVPFPPPDVTQPTGWPSAPTYSCDPAQICATLITIQQMLGQLQGGLAEANQTITLMQRYETPFAVIAGAIHSNLSGTGSFAIPRCIGMQLDLVDTPPGRTSPGVPPYLWNLGWVGAGTDSGMLLERRIARDHETWIRPTMQACTQFGWDLSPGVVLSVRELYAEP